MFFTASRPYFHYFVKLVGTEIGFGYWFSYVNIRREGLCEETGWLLSIGTWRRRLITCSEWRFPFDSG